MYQFLFLLEKRYPKDLIKMLTWTKKHSNIEKAYEVHGTIFEARVKERKEENKDMRGSSR